MSLDVPASASTGEPVRLTWRSELPRGCVRVARLTALPEKRFEHLPHCHEFAEFLWVESGRCEHVINGRTELLEVGDYRCIRPDDVHTPRSDGVVAGGLVNISFELAPLAGLIERYGADWPWAAAGAVPPGGHLSHFARERLLSWLEILVVPEPRRLDLESFLLDLMRVLSSDAGSVRATGLPPWLSVALEVFAEPRAMRGGVPELARLCGRTREHINRTVRTCQGRRATDLVNAIRLDWAAAQLHLTDRPLAEVAAECGLANLAHFYRLFHEVHGLTPAAWRRQARSSLPPRQPMNLAAWVAP